MKKLLLTIAIVLVAVSVGLLTAGCSNSISPSPSWADEENLTYAIQDTTTHENKGVMTVKTVRSPVNKTLNGKEYASADGKVTIDVEMTGEYTVHTEFLTSKYTVLALQKTYTDLTDASKNYVLNAKHGDGYYYYDKNGQTGEIKVGSSYTDSEYLYHYIRSYPLTSPPSGFSIADPTDGSAKKIVCSAVTVSDNTVTVPYPSSNKEVACKVIRISLSDKPHGASILAYFTPDETAYYMSGLSMFSSKKIPVKIIENDLTYVVTAMSVK